jgi:hypothetical protein
VSISCSDVGGAVGFQRPDLHLAETLAAELRLAAQRLLRDQAVGAGGTGVHLVVDQVVQLEHVHVAHGGRTLERLAGAAVEQLGLRARRRQALGLDDVVRVYASLSMLRISSSEAPSNTGVAKVDTLGQVAAISSTSSHRTAWRGLPCGRNRCTACP